MKKSIFFTVIIIFTLLSGCAASISEADFRESPETVRPADLQGPYSGIVIDVASKKPVSFAKIHFYYVFDTGKNSEKTVTVSTISDIDGKYYIKRFKKFKRWTPGYRLKSVKCAVFAKGYIPYFSDVSDSFFQYDNTIKMRIRISVHRASKLLIPFIGMPASTEELKPLFYEAAFELSEAEDPSLNASGLILPEQAMKILHISSIPLLKQNTVKAEESGYILYFDDGTKVSWHVWSALSSQIKTRFNKFFSQFTVQPQLRKTSANIRFYTGKENGVNIVLIPSFSKGLLIMLGCEGKKCTDKVLQNLALLAYERKNTLLFLGGTK